MPETTRIDLLKVGTDQVAAVDSQLRPEAQESDGQLFPRAFAAGGCNVPASLTQMENLKSG